MSVRIIIALVFIISIVGFQPKQVVSAEISGNIKLSDGWQPVVFMASISSPENLNVASPDFILAKTFINPDGSFSFGNVVLPADPQFYRFYLVKNESSLVEFNIKGNRNFVYFILDNSSTLSFSAEIAANSLSIINVRGVESNSRLLEFEAGYAVKRKKLTGEISKAQKEFLTRDLENYIRSFVDSCENSMVGLFALYHIEDKETDFLRNNTFYFNFQKKINKEYPLSVYANAYDELVQDLVGFRDIVCEIAGVIPKWKNQLIVAESIIIFILLLLLMFTLFQLRNNRTAKNEKYESKVLFDKLTQKEKEILQLLSVGKTNKEIALALFVELSTVKTHINSIYKQLEVSNRKEAIEFYNSKKE